MVHRGRALPHALCGVFIILRTAKALSIFENFGVLWIMIGRMVYDVIYWLGVVVFISIGFGVAYTILMPGQTYEYNRPFFRPFWGLLGDFDTVSIDEYFPLEQDSVLTRELSMLLTWIYTFFTTILLVNLLIAQMGYAKLQTPDDATCPPCLAMRWMVSLTRSGLFTSRAASCNPQHLTMVFPRIACPSL